MAMYKSELQIMHDDKILSGATWLILSGSTDPPVNVNAQHEQEDVHSDAKENGKYIYQIIKNVQILEHHVAQDKDYELGNSYRNMNAKKKDALNEIEGVFNAAIKNRHCKVCIYYTGHGSNGNWCFKDNIIKLSDIMNIANEYKKINQLFIYSQCCKSGNWCKQLEYYKHGKTHHKFIGLYASSQYGSVSYGNINGSTWTRYYFNNEKKYAVKNNLQFCLAEIHGQGKRYHSYAEAAEE
eukprot:432404_1